MMKRPALPPAAGARHDRGRRLRAAHSILGRPLAALDKRPARMGIPRFRSGWSPDPARQPRHLRPALADTSTSGRGRAGWREYEFRIEGKGCKPQIASPATLRYRRGNVWRTTIPSLGRWNHRRSIGTLHNNQLSNQCTHRGHQSWKDWSPGAATAVCLAKRQCSEFIRLALSRLSSRLPALLGDRGGCRPQGIGGKNDKAVPKLAIVDGSSG